jgi:HEAT repeat protein
VLVSYFEFQISDLPLGPFAGARIIDIIQRPFPIPSGEPLRRWRAIQALERIGSEESKAVLELLAKESPSLRERQEAKSALERLKRGPRTKP